MRLRWTRQAALAACAEWVAAYGEPPRALDLEPSRLYRRGDAEALVRRQAVPLPPRSSVDRLFGSVNGWLTAAGCETRRVGWQPR